MAFVYVRVSVCELSSSHACSVHYACCAYVMFACCLLYLDVSEEMWTALHLPASELKIVFLFPTVMLVAREALMELRTKMKGWLTM